jgi:hypothetical protein
VEWKDAGVLMKAEYFEPINPCGTVHEMRTEMNRLRRYDPLIHAVFTMHEYHGTGGEDQYAHLAYVALAQLREFKEAQMQTVMTHPNPPPILVHGSIIK